jgi:hypothetical protein
VIDMAKDPNNIPAFDPNTDWEHGGKEERDPLAELRAQLDRERAARVEAEKRANEYANAAHGAQVEVADNELKLVTSAIERVKENTASLKAAYAEALRNGAFDDAAEFQSQLGDNSARLLQLENGKAAMEAQPAPVAPQPIRTVVDPVEELASQLTAKSAAWVRAHPECARDKKLYAKMVAAHNITISNDIDPDTDEYFRSVEALVYDRPAARDLDTGADEPLSESARPAPQREAAPPAAPVSRGSSGRSATLTPLEREYAEISGMSEQEYAKAKEEMRKAGRMH